MERIAEEVKRLATDSDEASRKRLIDDLREISYSIETPDDTMQRLMYTHLQIAAVRVGIDLKLFNILAATGDPVTIEQLQLMTEAAPVLLGRLMRYLSSVGMIKEIRKDTFTATNVTKALAIPGNQAGIHHQFGTAGPLYQELPNFLAKMKYQDITDHTKTVHQVAHKTPLFAFHWFVEQPQLAGYFNEYMNHRRKGQTICWDVYPVEEEAQGWEAAATLLVDIGGNVGHQCAEFKQRFPQIPGHVVLEDLPGPIAMALSTPGVENKTHDMFEPQPVKGAKFYYLRAVLHDWPDHKCRDILQNIVAAMGPDSVILLDEMVLPDCSVHWQSTQIDLTMMAAMASIERTKAQWARLLDSVDLKIAEVYTYTPSIYESIMTVVRK